MRPGLSISRAGDPDVRCTLYAAANAVMTRSSRWSSLKVWGIQLAKTRGHRRAVVAVARKLAVILHRMWIDDSQFRWGAELSVIQPDTVEDDGEFSSHGHDGAAMASGLGELYSPDFQ